MEFSSRHILHLFLVMCIANMVSCNPLSSTGWGECSVTCGGGTQTRTHQGVEEERDCNTDDCPVDGGWGDFTLMYCASYTCTDATTVILSRNCDNPEPANGGANCPGPAAQILFNQECPDCTTTTHRPTTTTKFTTTTKVTTTAHI